jgi:hypothetical protein
MRMIVVDMDLYLWVNGLSVRTGWAHGFAKAYADYGIGLFAIVTRIQRTPLRRLITAT